MCFIVSRHPTKLYQHNISCDAIRFLPCEHVNDSGFSFEVPGNSPEGIQFNVSWFGYMATTLLCCVGDANAILS